MTEKNMAKADFYTAVALMAFGIAATVMARQMPEMPRDPYSAPGVLPAFLGLIITVLSLIMLIRSIARTRGRLGVSGESIKTVIRSAGVHRILVTIVLCLCYAYLLGKLMFPVLSFLFIFGFIVFFEYDRKTPFRPQIKKILVAALVALITSAMVTLIFRYLFLVRLP